MEFINQNKGKMHTKLPVSKIPRGTDFFYISNKLDGAYIQVHIDKEAAQVRFYTSGGKQFHLEKAGRGFMLASKHYEANYIVFETEYNYGNEGKHGDRTSSAKITTYRTEYEKGIKSVGSSQDRFSIFDTIEDDRSFEQRLPDISDILETVNIHVLEQTKVMYKDIEQLAKEKVSQGWEGLMGKSPWHVHQPTRPNSYRTNDIIKFKFPKVGIATVIREIEGDGRLKGMIGAVEVEFIHNNSKVTFNVGTGFSDLERCKWGEYKDKKIEFEYESIQILTPVQPSYKGLV